MRQKKNHFPTHSPKGGFTPNRGKGSRSVGIDEEAILEALEAGWKRELVYRKTQNGEVLTSNKQRAADVYYYTPCGKKLRSMPNILGYLASADITDLDQSNFSFAKRILTDSANEYERDANLGNYFGGMDRGKSAGGGGGGGGKKKDDFIDDSEVKTKKKKKKVR